MKINLSGLMRIETKPEPPPEEIQRHIAGISTAIERAGMKVTDACRQMLPTLARYTLCMADDGTKGNSSSSFEGVHRFVWEKNQGAKYAEEHRGILMLGTVGTGKTIALEIVQRITGAPMITMVELSAMFKRGGHAAVQKHIDSFNKSELIIDDIGAQTDAREYGDRLSPRDIIMQRYECWRKSGVRTHASANLQPKQLKSEEGIGVRAYDRLLEMCIPIAATGDSMRGNK